jgi:hypothetical protein
MNRSIVSSGRFTGFIAGIGLLFFSHAAMAQVEQPSQVTIQGTALITKDAKLGLRLTLSTCDEVGRIPCWIFLSIQ